MVSFVRNEFGLGHWRELEEKYYIRSIQQTLRLDAEKQKRVVKARAIFVESNVLHQTGRFHPALSKAKESLEIYRSVLGESDMSFLTVLMHVGLMQEKLNLHKNAQQTYEKTLLLRRQLLGEATLVDAFILNNLVNVHISLNNLTKAETVVVQATRLMSINRANSIYQGIALHNAARVYNLRGKFSQPESAALQAGRHLKTVSSQQNTTVIDNQLELAQSYMGQKKFAQAVTVYGAIVKRHAAFGGIQRLPASKQITLFEKYASALQANGDGTVAEKYRAEAAKLRLSNLTDPE